jgi:hypothetical protein
MVQDIDAVEMNDFVELEDVKKVEIPRDQLAQLLEAGKDLLQGEKVKKVMNMFRNPGLIDPADCEIHAQHTRQDNDFGVISLARNPFSESGEFKCIFAAGIHGPGTAHAVRMLADKSNFVERPLGGIIEVQISLQKDWPSRFEQAIPQWQTNPYSVKALEERLSSVLKRKSTSSNRTLTKEEKVFANVTADELSDCLKLLRSLSQHPNG